MEDERKEEEPTLEDDPGSPHSEATRGGDTEVDLDLAEVAAHVAKTRAPKALVAPSEPDAPLPAPPEPPAAPKPPEFKTATLREAQGPYRAGLVVTTDPSRSYKPDAKPPIFVDPKSFDSWDRTGEFVTAEPKKKNGNGGGKPGKADL